jgi:hypothetical protein
MRVWRALQKLRGRGTTLADQIADLVKERRRINKEIEKLCGGSGVKCPNCSRWSWELDEASSWDYSGFFERMTCSGCGHNSYWIFHMTLDTVAPPLNTETIIAGDDPTG